MKSVLVRLQEYSEKASGAERGIVKYILENPETSAESSVHELASAAFSSASTIVRLCRKLDFKGYKELQKSLLYELALRRESRSREEKEIGKGDSLEDIVSKVTYKNIVSLEDTMKLMDTEILKTCVGLLSSCDCVSLFGMGSSLLVARDLHLKMLRVNKNCRICDDWHAQLLQARNISKNDLAIMISYSGFTEETIACAEVVKRNGAPILAITRFDHSPLSRIADYTLSVAAAELIFRSGAMSSRISQLNVVDILYTAYVHENYDKCMAQFSKTHIHKPDSQNETQLAKENVNDNKTERN